MRQAPIGKESFDKYACLVYSETINKFLEDHAITIYTYWRVLSGLTVVYPTVRSPTFTAVSKSAQFTLHSGLECFVFFYRDKKLGNRDYGKKVKMQPLVQ